MKKNLFIASMLLLAACGQSNQKEAESVKAAARTAADTTIAVPAPACDCEKLQNQVDSLKAEIATFKKKRKKESTAKETERPAGKVLKKEKTAVVGKRD